MTFASSDEVREYLNECISAAVRVVVRDADRATDAIVLRALLNHVNQRFRFSYVIGNGPKPEESVADFDDEDEDENGASPKDVDLFSEEERGAVDLSATDELLASSVRRLRELAERLRGRLHAELDLSAEEEDDKRAR